MWCWMVLGGIKVVEGLNVTRFHVVGSSNGWRLLCGYGCKVLSCLPELNQPTHFSMTAKREVGHDVLNMSICDSASQGESPLGSV
ncbi:hypothetical protein CC80DRAFT_241108 [Byssothecium circinans]|uniref:Uncharacterized protein n=1 Tax=Byssothecium circinans TaxID=147558 RepID=A0A6A5TDM6_9PLEO|nr:hypothetical protein CC80DRAFT_241108 [Byssothecium circinans]